MQREQTAGDESLRITRIKQENKKINDDVRKDVGIRDSKLPDGFKIEIPSNLIDAPEKVYASNAQSIRSTYLTGNSPQTMPHQIDSCCNSQNFQSFDATV